MLSIKKISIKKIDRLSEQIDFLHIGVFKGFQPKKALKDLEVEDRTALISAIKVDSFKGDSGKTLVIYGRRNIKRICLYGLGKKEKINSDKLRSHGAKISRMSNKKELKSIDICIDSFLLDKSSGSQSVVEGLILGSYFFKEYKSQSKESLKLEDVFLIGGISQVSIKESKAIAESVSIARDLGNQPPNILTPAYLSDKAKCIAKEGNMKITVIDVKEFKKMGLNSFYGVAQGAKEPAKMILVEYRGAKKTEKPIALVGKGVTFDSGGISIKPSPKMDEMKFDMCGAATVLGVMNAVSVLQPKINIVFAVGATENMPGGNAQRPGDIVKAYNGKTIEVLNTDAEGRLVLADVLSYVNKNYSPACIIDFATLTGAVIVALGNRASGVMGNNDNLMKDILKSSIETDEKVWELPLWDEYKEDIKGTYADIQNIGKNGAGTITAGAFLKEFVGSTPWCHFDIAGTAWGPKTPSYQPDFGATGVAVRLIFDFIKNKS